MDWGMLFRGAILGFAIAAPVGPIGLLCIRQTLERGRTCGFISGLGAATADAFYGCLAGLGLSFASDLLLGHQFWLRLAGGLFLLYLGLGTLRTRPGGERALAPTSRQKLIYAFGSTFFLTVTNPLTVLSFAAMFGGLGVASGSNSYGSTALLVSGIFAGSAAWWLFLSSTVGLLREKLQPEALRWVNTIAGSILVGFGFFALLSIRS